MPQRIQTIGQYGVSLLHSMWITYTTAAYILCSEAVTYDTPFDKWSLHMIAITLGYYLSDLIEMVRTFSIVFILHHIATFYYLYLSYAYDLGGFFVIGMAVAESTAGVFNMRYIAYKVIPNDTKILRASCAVVYFLGRTIIGSQAIYECFVLYDIPWQAMVIPILITAVSTYWGIRMLIQTCKSCDLTQQ